MILENPAVVFAVKELKFKRSGWHTKLYHSYVARTKKQNNKKKILLQCMKTGFSPTKVGGIACCDHKMSSASSLSPYQAVCCTEHSAPASGSGLTSRHPPPFASLLSRPLSVSLLQWPTLTPPIPSPVTLRRSASIVSVQGPQCWQSSRPSEDISNLVPPLCC